MTTGDGETASRRGKTFLRSKKGVWSTSTARERSRGAYLTPACRLRVSAAIGVQVALSERFVCVGLRGKLALQPLIAGAATLKRYEAIKLEKL